MASREECHVAVQLAVAFRVVVGRVEGGGVCPGLTGLPSWCALERVKVMEQLDVVMPGV